MVVLCRRAVMSVPGGTCAAPVAFPSAWRVSERAHAEASVAARDELVGSDFYLVAVRIGDVERMGDAVVLKLWL